MKDGNFELAKAYYEQVLHSVDTAMARTLQAQAQAHAQAQAQAQQQKINDETKQVFFLSLFFFSFFIL